MNTRTQHFGFAQTALVLALLCAYGSALADDELDQLTKPDSLVVSAGAAAASTGSVKDRSIAGQYKGWGSNDAAALLDFELIRRDEATGTWIQAEGRDLGLDTRELRASYDRQGQWRLQGEYSEQVRRDPRTLLTGMTGVGTAQPVINTLTSAGTGSPQNLEVKRSAYQIGGEFWVSPGLLLEASIKNEDKRGATLGGIGNYCGPVIAGYRCATTTGALLALAEPVNSTTVQTEAKVHFMGSNYGLTLGYYGSSFKNNTGSMRIAGVNGGLVDLAGTPVALAFGPNTLGDLLLQPLGLAPDNDAYQLYVSGNYAFTPSIHSTFHYAQTRATQNQSFAAMGLAGAAGLPAGLGGVVDTTLMQAGVTARPLPGLNLLANIRFEDTDDSTPQALYGGTYINANNSSQKASSKAEASYMLPQNVRATVGVDYHWVKRHVPGVGSTALVIPTGSLTSVREYTHELTYRAELRKPLGDTVNGSIALLQSFRNGSHWINLGSTSATYPLSYQAMRWADVYTPTGIFPTNMMDRRRDKVRAMVDWSVSDALSLQFNAEQGEDKYSAPTQAGMHAGDLTSLGVDASYAVSDNWRATGYYNLGVQSMRMRQSVGYIARIDTTTSSLGLGLNGKLGAKLAVGGELSLFSDVTNYGMASGTAAVAGAVPDVSYRALALKLHGSYALDKQSDIRLDLVHQNINFDEWIWGSSGVPFAFSDNSTVAMQANQNVTYLGVKYVYRLK